VEYIHTETPGTYEKLAEIIIGKIKDAL